MFRTLIHHRIIQNTGWLALLQVFSYAAPLLVLPYLARLLTVEAFGAVMIAMATVAVASVVTDYGFSLSATYNISRKRDDRQYVNSLIARIFTAKIGLLVLSLIIVIAVSALPKYRPYQDVFLAGIVAVIAQAYQSPWLFQGLERMRTYTLYMGSIRACYVLLIFLFVNESTGPAAVLWCWSAANAGGAVIAMMSIRRMGYSLTLAPPAHAWSEVLESAQFFWSRVAVAFYTSGSSIVVGTAGLYESGIYTSAEQGYKAGQAVTGTLAQALYPYMAREKNWRIFRYVVTLGFLIVAAVSTVVALNSERLVILVFGQAYQGAAAVLTIFAITVVVNFLGVCLGYPAMAAAGRLPWANRSVYIAAGAFVILVTADYLISGISATSVALIVLAVECLVVIVRIWVLTLKSASTSVDRH